eukprot:7492582-Pyramimonas_sp.AAC.2
MSMDNLLQERVERAISRFVALFCPPPTCARHFRCSSRRSSGDLCDVSSEHMHPVRQPFVARSNSRCATSTVIRFAQCVFQNRPSGRS